MKCSLFYRINQQQKYFLFAICASFIFWLILDSLLGIDYWLTKWIANGGSMFIELFSSESTTVKAIALDGSMQIKGENAKMLVSHSCNGKAIIFLFNAFIWAMPIVKSERKVIFSIIGSLILIFANMIRVAGLYCIYRHLPQWFSFFHHSIFQLAMYGLVLAGWMKLVGKKSL